MSHKYHVYAGPRPRSNVGNEKTHQEMGGLLRLLGDGTDISDTHCASVFGKCCTYRQLFSSFWGIEGSDIRFLNLFFNLRVMVGSMQEMQRLSTRNMKSASRVQNPPESVEFISH